MRILGLDPGLAAFGVAVIEVHPRRTMEMEVAAGVTSVLHLEVLRTAKASKKRNLRQADDLSERSREIYRRLSVLVNIQKPDVLAIEACALPFGKARFSIVSALGRVRGLVDALAQQHGFAIVEFFPQELKKLLTGKKDASKDEVRHALERCFLPLPWPTQKGLVEHAADALAAAYCAREVDLVKAMLRVQESAVRSSG